MEWSVLAIEIGLVVGALLILGLGLFWPKHQTRAWAWIGMGLLVFVPIVALVNGWFDPYSTKVFQGLTADSLSFLFKCAFLIAGLMVVLTAMNEISLHSPWLISLLLIAIASMCFSSMASDLILALVSAELVAICMSVFPAALANKKTHFEATAKYLLSNGLATVVSIIGLAITMAFVHSPAFTDIKATLESPFKENSYLFVGLLLFCSAMMFKLAIVPFQLWAADVYQGYPLPALLLLATGSKLVGVILITRLLLCTLPYAPTEVFTLLSAIVILSLAYGTLCAIPQNNYKRLLGYSSIANSGFIFASILLLVSPSTTTSNLLGITIYYCIAYMLSVAAAVLASESAWQYYPPEPNNPQEKKDYFIITTAAFGLISLAGIPPTAGFFAKFLVLKELFLAAKTSYSFLTLFCAALICGVVGTYYYLRALGSIITPIKSNSLTIKVHHPATKLFILLLCLSIVGFGTLHGPVLEKITTLLTPYPKVSP